MNSQQLNRIIAGVLAFVTFALAANAQVLTVTNNLQLWLEADAGITTNATGGVIQWADQTPNANNAVQTDDTAAPLFVTGAQNGKPALRFDGVNDYLDVASSPSVAITGDLSSFFVVKFDDFSDYRAVWGKTALNLPAPTDYYVVPGTGVPRLYRGDGLSPDPADIGSADGTAHFRAATYLVAGFEMAGTTATHYLNGQSVGGGEITITPMDGGTPLKIGTRDDLFTKMKGEIAELLIYDTALSDSDRNSVMSYLQTKYNIVNLPPTIALSGSVVGTNANAGEVITLTATAADPDGFVAKVDFLANGQPIGTATASPYSVRVSIETVGTVAFTAVATDNKDGTATSAPVTLAVTSSPPSSLTVTNGLQLWLKAGAGVTAGANGEVTTWADQSGNGNDASQQLDINFAPLLVTNAANGQSVLRFDGVDDYLEVPPSPGVTITNDIASFFVVKFDDFATYRAVWGKTLLNQPRPTDYYVLPGSGIPRAFRGGDAGNALVDGAARLATNTYLVLGFNQAGSAFAHYLNGAPFGAGLMNVTPTDAGTPLKIGTRDDFATQMKGDIAELLIYNTALDDAGLKSLAAYLGSKYGVPIIAPTNSLPQVTIDLPTNGAAFVAPTNITVTATATDGDGSVVRADFYLDGGLVATGTNLPFTATIGLVAPGTFSLTAVATDNLGGVSTSAPVSITVTSTQTFPLPAAARLKLWLRADAGATTNQAGGVIGWADQSGKSNLAQQTNDSATPLWVDGVLNGRPVVRFDGDNDYLVVDSTPSIEITGDITSFFVVEFDDFATYRAVWAKTEGNQPRSTDYYIVPNTGIARFIRGGTGGVGNVDGVTAFTPGQYAIAGFDMAGGTARHFLNGQVDSTGVIGVTPTDAATALLIGTRGDLFTKMKGDIAEIVVYDTALSDTDRSTVFSYLANKYGIDIGGAAPAFTVTLTGGDITISWPESATGFQLESTATLPSTSWTPVAFNPPPPGQNPSVTITPTNGSAFFRLRKP